MTSPIHTDGLSLLDLPHPYDVPCANCVHKRGDHVAGDDECGHDCECERFLSPDCGADDPTGELVCTRDVGHDGPHGNWFRHVQPDPVRTALADTLEALADAAQDLELLGGELVLHCCRDDAATERARERGLLAQERAAKMAAVMERARKVMEGTK